MGLAQDPSMQNFKMLGSLLLWYGGQREEAQSLNTTKHSPEITQEAPKLTSIVPLKHVLQINKTIHCLELFV